jgi:hypothetical protein
MKENETQEGIDTEAGLEPEPHDAPQYVDEEEALRFEFQKAVEDSAEERAQTPFQVAAMTHARMCGPFLQEVDNLSGGAAKRILKYLVAYPFYVKELNAQNKRTEAAAQIADRLVQTKFTMAMCQAIEKEARVTKAIAEQEALIEPLPDDLTTLNTEENKE